MKTFWIVHTNKNNNMIARKFDSEPTRENPHNVDVRQLYNRESAQIMHIVLKPGESLKPHRTPVDVAFYILEGTPVVHVGDEARAVREVVLVESDQRAGGADVDLGDIGLDRLQLDLDEADEVFGRRG